MLIIERGLEYINGYVIVFDAAKTLIFRCRACEIYLAQGLPVQNVTSATTKDIRNNKKRLALIVFDRRASRRAIVRSEVNILKLAIILVIFALVIFSFIIKETHRSLPFSASAQQQQSQQHQPSLPASSQQRQQQSQQEPRQSEEQQQQQEIQKEPSSTSAGLSINRSLDIPGADENTTEQNSLTTTGSFGDDRIIGSDATDILLGLLGADVLQGRAADDIIQGNEDIDKLYGDAGNDVLQGGTASDQLYGGLGNDTIIGGTGDDYLSGEDGNDKLYGGKDDDIMQGGQGADYFDCGEGIDMIIDFNLEQGDDSGGNCEER